MTCSVYIIDNLPEGQGIHSIGKNASNHVSELPAYWLAASAAGKIASSRKVYSTFLEFLRAEKALCTADYIMFASTAQQISAEELRGVFTLAAANKASANFFPTVSTEDSLSQWAAVEIYGCSILLLDCNAQTEARIPFQGLVLSKAFFAEVATEACKLKTEDKSSGSWRETSRSLDGIVSKVAYRLGQRVRINKRPSFALVRSQGLLDIVSLREMLATSILGLFGSMHEPAGAIFHIQKYWEWLINFPFQFRKLMRSIKRNGLRNFVSNIYTLKTQPEVPELFKKHVSLPCSRARAMLETICNADFCRVEVLRLDLELPTKPD